VAAEELGAGSGRGGRRRRGAGGACLPILLGPGVLLQGLVVRLAGVVLEAQRVGDLLERPVGLAVGGVVELRGGGAAGVSARAAGGAGAGRRAGAAADSRYRRSPPAGRCRGG
jgi:hypothetical protein